MLGTLKEVRHWLFLIAGMGCGFELRPAVTDASGSADGPADAPADSSIDAPPPACVGMGGYDPGGPQAGHRYKVLNNAVNYDEAMERCAADGAHLVQIDDAAENSYVDQLLDGSTAWIGLNDLDREGTYGWVTRSPGMFRAYAPSEPNDNGTEDCFNMRSDGLWNDDGCDSQYVGVCECDPAYVAPAVAACRLTPGAMNLEGRRYFIRTASLGWPEAVAECSAIGAYLAVPSDDDENSAIDTSFIADSWIGFADRNPVDGIFEWINGATPGYTRFGPAQPTHLSGEDCVAISIAVPSGSWDDTACSILRDYACECDPLVR